MPRRKKRLDRKLHKRCLQENDVVLLCLCKAWRLPLFAAPFYQPFPIDTQHREGLDQETVRVIRRYNLSFVVYRVPPIEIETFRGKEMPFTYFRFCASRYPDIFTESYNNMQSDGSGNEICPNLTTPQPNA